jgi:anti-sigma regulatory factor (Ser/Thr protein kinase)
VVSLVAHPHPGDIRTEMPDPFRHEALPYGGHGEFVPSCAGVVEAGLADDRRVIMLAREESLAGVRDALGPAAEEVTFVPTDDHGRNPARITTMLDSFQAAGEGRRGLGINEWSGASRSPAARAETRLAESLLNVVALQAWPLDVVCLYDSDSLAADEFDEVRRSHPFLRGEEANAAYEPDLASALFAGPLIDRPDGVDPIDFGADDLADLRAHVREFARGCDIAPDRVDDFVLAANEIVTNSVRHGGGQGRLALWAAEPSVICEVTDNGHLAEPLAGRLAPPPRADSGRGLWLANNLCDLVQIRSSQAGTVVRLYIDRL